MLWMERLKPQGGCQFVRKHSGRLARNTWVIYLQLGDSLSKERVIPDVYSFSQGEFYKGAQVPIGDELASYQLVGRVTAYQGFWRVAGLRGWSAARGLRHCPDSYGRLQSRIFSNGGNPDYVTPREGWRSSDCKPLSMGKKLPVNSRNWRYPEKKPWPTLCQQPR